MGGMTHENDVRIAEGLQNMSLPDDPAEAMAAWRGAVNDAVTQVAPGPRLRLPRPERPGSPRRHRPDRVLLPALLHPAAVQQRLVVPDPSAGARGDPVRGLVAHPLPERPLARASPRRRSRWRPTTRAGRRSPRRTSPTCRGSRKACTPRDSSTCGCRTRSKG